MAALGYFRVLFGNYLAGATITPSTEAAGFDADNLADNNRQNVYKPGTPPAAETVKFAFGSPVACTGFALLNHTLYSAGCTSIALKVGDADNGSTFDDTVQSITLTSDADVYWVFTLHTKAYWQLCFTTVSTVPQIGEAYLGPIVDLDFLQWPERRYPRYGVAVYQTIGGQGNGEVFGGQLLEDIEADAAMTATQKATFVNINAFHKDGALPLVLLDKDEDSASGAAKYCRMVGPFPRSQSFEKYEVSSVRFNQEV